MSALTAEPADAPEEHKLHRQLGLRDLVLAQILCVVGSSWVGIAAGLGRGQTLTWIAAMLLFYLPMGAVVIALNTIMPLEGGVYVWAHRAFGNLGGFLTAWNLWVYGVAVTATILYAIPTELSYLIGPAAAWLPENHLASLAIVSLIMVAITFAAVRGLELGKWIHNIGGIAMLAVFAGLILLPVYGLWRGEITHPVNVGLELPPRNLRTMALFGQMLVGALSGLEYIAIFAGESRQPTRSIARSVWISSPIICLMFILGTSSIVVFTRSGLHGGHIDFIAPIPQTLRIALGNSGLGNLVAMATILLLQLRLLGAASYIFTGVTRLPMAVGWDRLLPEWFTRLDRRSVPVPSILCTSGLVLGMVLLANVGVHAQEAFQVLTNASETHYEIAYLAMFAIPVVGSMALRQQLKWWLKWVSLVGFCATLFSLLISAYPFVNVVSPLAYAAKIVGAVVFSNGLAVGLYWTRGRGAHARNGSSMDSGTAAT
jgi:amino acid transporter